MGGVFPIGETYVLNPVGEGNVLRLLAPVFLYCGTTDMGVYRSIDSSLWQAVNTGIQSLTVVDLGGTSGQNAVAITGLSGNRAINVLSGSTWAVVLTDAQARTLTGNADLAATLVDVERDQVTNYIYAIFTRVDIAQTTVPLFVLKSIDNGQNWTSSTVENALFRYREVGNIVAYNDNVAFGMGFNIPARTRIFISTNGGTIWNETVSLGSLFVPFMFINPYNPTFIYSRGNGGVDLIRVNFDTTISTIQAGIQLTRSDAMTFASANEQYIFERNANTLYTTNNAWSTFGSQIVVNDGGIFYYNSILFFGDTAPTPSTVMQTVALLNASGPFPDVPPYTNSIPEISGGIAERRALLAV